MNADRIIWAQHDGDSKWHAIREVTEGSSAVTVCDGRWPASDCVALDVNPAVEDRCKRCDVVVFGAALQRGSES